jgi:hypothetical protein
MVSNTEKIQRKNRDDIKNYTICTLKEIKNNKGLNKKAFDIK